VQQGDTIFYARLESRTGLLNPLPSSVTRPWQTID